jgi:hypothetical protein
MYIYLLMGNSIMSIFFPILKHFTWLSDMIFKAEMILVYPFTLMLLYSPLDVNPVENRVW